MVLVRFRAVAEEAIRSLAVILLILRVTRIYWGLFFLTDHSRSFLWMVSLRTAGGSLDSFDLRSRFFFGPKRRRAVYRKQKRSVAATLLTAIAQQGLWERCASCCRAVNQQRLSGRSLLLSTTQMQLRWRRRQIRKRRGTWFEGK